MLNFRILRYDWLIALYLLTSLLRNVSFLIVKCSCVREELSDVVFLIQTKLQQITMQEHIFSVFALTYLTFGLCTSPTDISPSPTTCTIVDFQQLIFRNSRSPDKFTVKPTIVSH